MYLAAQSWRKECVNMNFIDSEIERRKLPKLPEFDVNDPESARRRLVLILSEHEYGFNTDFPFEVTGKVALSKDNYYGGTAIAEDMVVTVTTPRGPHDLYVFVSRPKTDKPVPLFLYIGFAYASGGFRKGQFGGDNGIPNRQRLCEEEIVDNGCALAVIYNNDITADNSDFSDGLAGKFGRNASGVASWGKLGYWAWAASRALDYLLTFDCYDRSRIAVVGHSRLGKTALWCAAQDTRVTHAISNDSGCSGAAITRGKQGERIADICGRLFPYWFCEKYKDYIGEEATAAMPFDQHFLAAAIAPRKLYIASASLDKWADPESEYLTACIVGKVYEQFGLPGFFGNFDRYPEPGEEFHGGSVEYHLRPGEHAIVRYDLKRYIDFLKR